MTGGRRRKGTLSRASFSLIPRTYTRRGKLSGRQSGGACPVSFFFVVTARGAVGGGGAPIFWFHTYRIVRFFHLGCKPPRPFPVPGWRALARLLVGAQPPRPSRRVPRQPPRALLRPLRPPCARSSTMKSGTARAFSGDPRPVTALVLQTISVKIQFSSSPARFFLSCGVLPPECIECAVNQCFTPVLSPPWLRRARRSVPLVCAMQIVPAAPFFRPSRFTCRIC